MQPREMRWRWALIVPMAFVRGAMEGAAAAAVFAMIKVIIDPSQIARLPIVSEIAALLPWRNLQTQVMALAGLVAVYCLLKNLFVLGAEYLRHKVVGESIVALKNTLNRGYVELPFLVLARRNSAELIWNVTSGVDTVCQEAMSTPAAIASEILTVASIAIVLPITAPKVTLIAAPLLIAIVALLLQLMYQMAVHSGRERDRISKSIFQTLSETLGGVREIKALGRETFFYRALDEKLRQILRLGYIAKSLEGSTPVVVETVFVGGALIVIAMLAGSGASRSESLSLLALFSYAAFRIVPAANRIAWRVNQIRGASYASEYSLR